MDYEDHKSREDRMGDYDTDHDRALLVGVIILIIICVGLILYSPDIEVIGGWVHNTIN